MRPSARAACTQTSGSGCRRSGCRTVSVRPTRSGSAEEGMPRTLTSRQRAASTRPRSAPCAGPRTMASNVSFDPQIQRPSAGTSSALAPASQIRISSRARASAFSGEASAAPPPSSGAHPSASSSGPSTTRALAGVTTRASRRGTARAAESSGARSMSRRHVESAQNEKTIPP